MSLFTKDGAEKLLALTKEPNEGDKPWMQPAHRTLEDTETVADEMMAAIGSCYKWEWPNRAQHLQNRQEEVDPVERLRSQWDTTEEEYRERMRRMDTAPARYSKMEESWLRCAIIAALSLEYLELFAQENPTLDIQIPAWQFYEYIAVCLREGVPAYVNELMPPGAGANHDTRWFINASKSVLKRVQTRWHEGETLEDINNTLTFKDTEPLPEAAPSQSWGIIRARVMVMRRRPQTPQKTTD